MRRRKNTQPPAIETVLAQLPPLSTLGRRWGMLAAELAAELDHTTASTWATLDALRRQQRAVTVHRRWFKL